MMVSSKDDYEIPAFLRRVKGEQPNTTSDIDATVTPRMGEIIPATARINIQRSALEPSEAPNVQERIREKVSDIIGNIEGEIDDGLIFLGWSCYGFLQAKALSKPIANGIANHFRGPFSELMEILALRAIKTPDRTSDLWNGYTGYATSDIERMAALYYSIIEDCETYAENKKKERRPRAKKKPSVEKQLKGVRYLKAHDKLVSVDPSKILGAAEVWLYSPSAKVLTVYRAIDQGGLKLKACSFKNFDEKTSKSKVIGRKEPEVLEAILKGGKTDRRKVFDGVNTREQTPWNLSQKIIILRVC